MYLLNCDFYIWQIEENTYFYDGHTEMIKILRNTGELEKLREAREKMSQYFPLTQGTFHTYKPQTSIFSYFQTLRF